MTWVARLWPISRFVDWMEWRRRDREETLVATRSYITQWTRDGAPTGIETEHHVRFLIDGNRIRYARIDSGPKSVDIEAGKVHPVIRREIFGWQTHGDLPSGARRPDDHPRGKLILIDGGAA